MSSDNYYNERVNLQTFLFEIDGVEIGYFMEVRGLEVSVATESVEEGGQNGYVHQLPGRMSWPNITLKRGITQSDALLEWMNKTSGEQFAGSGNKLSRSTAAITLMSADGTRLRAWEFVDAFPVKWSGPEFAVDAANAATEQLEIAHHGFKSKNL